MDSEFHDGGQDDERAISKAQTLTKGGHLAKTFYDHFEDKFLDIVNRPPNEQSFAISPKVFDAFLVSHEFVDGDLEHEMMMLRRDKHLTMLKKAAETKLYGGPAFTIDVEQRKYVWRVRLISNNPTEVVCDMTKSFSTTMANKQKRFAAIKDRALNDPAVLSNPHLVAQWRMFDTTVSANVRAHESLLESLHHTAEKMQIETEQAQRNYYSKRTDLLEHGGDGEG